MSHELDINTQTGEAAMLSVRETPWHRLGVVLDEAADLDDALHIAGLDWRVEKQPHYIQIPLREGSTLLQLKKSGDAFSIVRLDRHEVIGTVGASYGALQNEDAFGVLRPVLDSGVAQIETAGSLRRGKQVWMLVKFDVETIVQKAIEAGASPQLLSLLIDENVPYGLFTNDHSGGARARIKETAVRVVCANTFGVAMGRDEEGTSVEIVHSESVVESYKTAAQLLLTGMGTRFAKLAEARAQMKSTKLTARAHRILVLEPTIPVIHLERKIQRREDTGHTRTALTKASYKRNRITELWEDGAGHSGDESAWEAFQGLVEWLDHDQQSLTGQDNRDERRVTSLHDGTLGQIKSRIARRLFTYSTHDSDGQDKMLAQLG